MAFTKMFFNAYPLQISGWCRNTKIVLDASCWKQPVFIQRKKTVHVNWLRQGWQHTHVCPISGHHNWGGVIPHSFCHFSPSHDESPAWVADMASLIKGGHQGHCLCPVSSIKDVALFGDPFLCPLGWCWVACSIRPIKTLTATYDGFSAPCRVSYWKKGYWKSRFYKWSTKSVFLLLICQHFGMAERSCFWRNSLFLQSNSSLHSSAIPHF